MKNTTRITNQSIRVLAGAVASILQLSRGLSLTRNLCVGAAVLAAISLPMQQSIADEGEGDGDSTDCADGGCGGSEGGEPNDSGEGEVCQDESECDDCNKGDSGDGLSEEPDGPLQNRPVNWETGEKWETISDLVVAVSGKDYRLTRQYSSSPQYSGGNMYTSRYSPGSGFGGFSQDPSVGAHWAFSNLRALFVRKNFECKTESCLIPIPGTGEFYTDYDTIPSYVDTDVSLIRPGRKPRKFKMNLQFGYSVDNSPGNQRLYIKDDEDFSNGGFAGSCGGGACFAASPRPAGLISGNVVFEDPGRWRQEFKLTDGIGYIVDDQDENGNRRHYKNGTNGLPEYIWLNGGGDDGGNLIWGDQNMAEARIQLFWATIDGREVLSRAEVHRPTASGSVLTQYVEYYHLVDNAVQGQPEDLSVKFHDGTSYQDLIDPSTSLALEPTIDLGVEGDLVQVIRYRVVNPAVSEQNRQFRAQIQQYRYHDNRTALNEGDIRLRTQGFAHQLKLTIAPQQIEFLAQNESGTTSPTTDTLFEESIKLLKLDDHVEAAVVDGVSVKLFESAQKIISYTQTGDSPVDHQFLLAASCGCGSSGTQSAVLLEYEQFDDWEYSFPAAIGTEEVPGQSMHIKEHSLTDFSSYPTAHPYRTFAIDLLMLGDDNQFPYRWMKTTLEGNGDITVDSDGDGQNNRAWVNRTNYDREDRIVTGRTMPSAFSGYTLATSTSAPAFTVKAGEGLSVRYGYANENVGQKSYGPQGGPFDLTKKTTYNSDADPEFEAVREFLPIQEDYYRVAGSTAEDDIETVQYVYGWDDDTIASAKLDWKRTKEERELQEENGPVGTGLQVSSWEFYDDHGNVIWRADAENVLTRYEYDPIHGRLVKRVENSKSPDELTLPSSANDPLYATLNDLVEPAQDNPFPSSTGSDGELVTEYKRDVLGRLTQVVYPGGVTHTIVREMLQDSTRPGVLYFAKSYLPHLASDPSASPKVFSGPISTRFMDAANKSLRNSGYELDVAGTYTPETVTSRDSIAGNELSRSTQTFGLSGSPTENTRWWDVAADRSHTTLMGYDSFGRLSEVTDPNDTISETSFDSMDRAIAIKVGTTTSMPETVVEYVYDGDSDAGASMVQGTGNGSLTGVRLHDGGGVIRVSSIYYDHRDRQVAIVSPDASMVLTHYDNLDRSIESAVYPEPDTPPTTSDLLTIVSGSLPVSHADLNLPGTETRAAYSKTHYSQRGYLWKSQTAIDPGSSSPGYLESHSWYDDDGNEVAFWAPNSPKVVSEYDAHDRVTRLMLTDRAGDVTSTLTYSGVTGISDDNVLEQAEYSYKLDSGLLHMITSRMRVHDDTSTGILTGGNSITSYMAYVYDEAQRIVGSVDFGTNKSTANPFSKTAGSVPNLANYDTLDKLREATSILFGWQIYNSRGTIEDVVSIQDGIDESDEIRLRYLYDDMYRTIATIENADAVSGLVWDSTKLRYTVSGFDYTKQDTDRVTSLVYDGVNNVVKRVAHIPGNGGGVTAEEVQVTEYVYGVTKGSSTNTMDSLLSSNNILSEVRYPNEVTGEAAVLVDAQNHEYSDPQYTVQYAYNRLGEVRGVIDQNGTLRSFGRDEQGRTKFDRVDTLGTYLVQGVTRTVDSEIRRLGYSFDSLGRMSSVASFEDTAGTVYRDEVQMGYTPLWQVETVTQQHDGAVDSNSAQVLYKYASESPVNGDKNYTRLTDIVYPTDNTGGTSDQTVEYLYSSGVDDRLSRINNIGVMDFQQAGVANLVNYKRIGLGILAQSKVNVQSASAIDSFTLDRTFEHDGTQTAGTYPALDKFGRVTRHMVLPNGFGVGTGGNSNKPAVFEITHSYDRSSNRLTYHDAREGSRIPGRDRNFVYDRLNRLIEEARSPLPATSGYSTQHSGHQWALDMLGNWDSVTNDGDNDGDFTDSPSYLDDRASNSANEIDNAAQGQYDRKVFNGSFTPTWYDYHYDDSGNLTDERRAGQLQAPPYTIQQGRQHSYDAWNRLVKSEMRSIDGLSTVPISTTTYNALGWRTSKKMDTAIGAYDGTLDQERTFFYGASWRVLEEHVDSDISSTNDDVWISQEFWGTRYIDDSVAKRIDRGGTGDWATSNQDLTHWFRVTDSQFSVVVVINEFGLVHERVSYDAYGNASHRYGGDADGSGSWTNSDLSYGYNQSIGSSSYHADLDVNLDGAYNGTDIGIITSTEWSVPLNGIVPSGWISDPTDDDGPDNSIGYAGYMFNADREDYSVRYRVYSPELGRWMQRDPIGYLGGGNLYEYVGGMVIKSVDPMGLAPHSSGGGGGHTPGSMASRCGEVDWDCVGSDPDVQAAKNAYNAAKGDPTPSNGTDDSVAGGLVVAATSDSMSAFVPEFIDESMTDLKMNGLGKVGKQVVGKSVGGVTTGLEMILAGQDGDAYDVVQAGVSGGISMAAGTAAFTVVASVLGGPVGFVVAVGVGYAADYAIDELSRDPKHVRDAHDAYINAINKAVENCRY